MAAYVIAENLGVSDPAGMQEYRSQVAATIERYGGRFLVRGSAPQPLEADWKPAFVVIQFDSAEQARAWHDSPEYRPLRDLRQRCSDSRLVLFEGV